MGRKDDPNRTSWTPLTRIYVVGRGFSLPAEYALRRKVMRSGLRPVAIPCNDNSYHGRFTPPVDAQARSETASAASNVLRRPILCKKRMSRYWRSRNALGWLLHESRWIRVDGKGEVLGPAPPSGPVAPLPYLPTSENAFPSCG